MRKGSTRFSDAMRQTEGGDSVEISHKPSKKLKTFSVGGMDKSNCSKRVKLPRKLLDDYHTINLVSVPRKLRSVMKKRYSEYVSPSSPNLTNGISRFEMPFIDRNKKLKVDPDKQHSIKPKSIAEQIMKDEEEAIAGLLALAGNDNTHEINLNNEISEAEASKPEDLVKKCVQIDELNESRNRVDVNKYSKDVTDGNKSRKRCSSHVYICRIIKDLQITEGKIVNSRKEPKTDTRHTTPENVAIVNAGINLNEGITVSKTIFQDQPRGRGVQPSFGNPFFDPSQWSRPVFPKQQMWMNPFMYKPAQSGSYVQASLHNVLGSKQHLPFKMQFSHHASSGHDENGGLFRVDSPPTLKLELQ